VELFEDIICCRMIDDVLLGQFGVCALMIWLEMAMCHSVRGGWLVRPSYKLWLKRVAVPCFDSPRLRGPSL
jgi:hypothetical protein